MFTTVFFTNTLPSAPGTERGARGHNRGFLRGGPAGAGLSPLLFLSHWSGRCQRHLVQHYLGPGTLSHRWMASGQAWAVGLGLGSWLNSWRRELCWLLSRRHLGCDSKQLQSWSAWAGSCLGRLLCGCEEFSIQFSIYIYIYIYEDLQHKFWKCWDVFKFE